jgi:hypothetical protein
MVFSLEGVFERGEGGHGVAAPEEGHTIWLFFGSDKGGRTLATLCSLTATCELRGVNPWVYLQDTLTRLPATPPDQHASLLPDAAQ